MKKTSDSARELAKKKAKTGRTDKTGASGMGMTKSGVKAKADYAGTKAFLDASAEGLASIDPYSGRLADTMVTKFKKDDPSGSKANKKANNARDAVFKSYGMGK